MSQNQMMRLEIVNDKSVNDKKKVECLEVLSGTLDLRASPPHAAKARRPSPSAPTVLAKSPYQLDCTGGKSWKRMMQVRQTGANTFIGIDRMRFDVANDEIFTRLPRDTPSLTAHAAHTTPSNFLISLDCRFHPSWGRYKSMRGKRDFRFHLNSS